MSGNRWPARVLSLAGICSILWGAAVVLFPSATAPLAGWVSIHPLAIWQCFGMVVGVYGVGYFVAARDPSRHWLIVLVGLLGKVFEPIILLVGAWRSEATWQIGWTILFNDLVWWLPFGLILYRVHREHRLDELARQAAAEAMGVDLLDAMPAHDGALVRELSYQRPTLLVFLRHSGCTFCRRTLADLARVQPLLNENGVALALVHMGTEPEVGRLIARYQLENVPRVCDPECELYRAFDLPRASWRLFIGLSALRQRFQAAVVEGHGAGLPAGDTRRLPGAFVLWDGEVESSLRPRRISDRLDFAALARRYGPTGQFAGRSE